MTLQARLIKLRIFVIIQLPRSYGDHTLVLVVPCPILSFKAWRTVRERQDGVDEIKSHEPLTRFDLQGLSAGMYFLEIRVGEEAIWEKVWGR